MKKKPISNVGKVFDIILLIIQTILSVVVGYFATKILPTKYLIILIILLILLFLIDLFALKLLKLKSVVTRVIARIFTIIICIILGIGSVVAYQGFDVLGRVTGGKVQTHVVSVTVLKDSEYQKINDLEKKTIGYVVKTDEERTKEAIDCIKNQEKVNIKTTAYDNFEALTNALANKEVDAIMFNEAYRGLILDVNGNFDNETRVIYTYEKDEKVKEIKGVNDVTTNAFNVFISGIDVYGKVSTVSRSDVNMILTVNPKSKTILMTSIPRDYYVELASFKAMDKLTHAGIYGVNESMDTLSNVFGCEINYYAKVNFTSLITIVDALGGINVENDQSFVSLHDGFSYEVGEVHLDGVHALEFCRERYSLANGDNDRIRNHQKVLTGIIDKALSPTIITNYSSILKSIDGSFETNLSAKDIQSLIQMQLNEGGNWKIIQNTVKGKGTSSTTCYSMPGPSLYVMIPNNASVEKAESIIEHVMNDDLEDDELEALINEK